MRLPDIQARLRELAEDHSIPELSELADKMRRRSSTRTAPRSVSVTPELRQRIRDYARAHPAMSRVAVAEVFNVNPGRVSEAVRGKRQ